MADKRISQLVERVDIANNDVLPIVASGATTTNKVTISSIQTYMQENLDVGVTSVGITIGTSGTDVSVTGSPVTTSGNITINIPTASATNRGLLSAADWTTFNNKQDAGSYVTLDTTQTITAQKTFTTSGSSDTMIISHGSGSGFALDVLKAGNGEAIRVTKSSGTGNAMTISGGNFEAGTIVKTGGTSSQFLKADGSVDSNTYLTTGSAGSTYVPYSGAAASVNLGVYSITANAINSAGSGSTAGQINLRSDAFFSLVNGYGSIASGTTNQFNLYQTTGAGVFRGAILSLNSITASATRTYTLPDADGTLALGSDLGAYLPLTGGTLTGALNGTSASFSGELSVTSGLLSISGAGSNPPSSGVGLRFVDNRLLIYGGSQDITFQKHDNTGSNLIILESGEATFSSSVRALSFSANVDSFGTDISANNSIRIGSAFSNPASVIFGDAGTPYWVIGRPGGSGNFAIGSFAVSNALTINAGTGNVGIGTPIPAAKLNVSGIDNGTSIRLDHTSSYTMLYSYINGGSPIGFDNLSGTLVTYVGGGEKTRITSLGFLKASNTGSYVDATGNYHELRTNQTDQWTNIISNTSASPYALSISYPNTTPNNADNWFIFCQDSTSARFRVASNGNVTNINGSYGSISDAKLKENIEDATPKLDDLMKVKVRNYNLIGDDKKQIGVIAQELEEIFPAMIDESEDFEEVEVPQLDEEGNEVLNEEGEVVTEKQRVSKGTSTKSVKYSVFVPMLIKAMQEQQEQIKVLTEQINSLKNQMQ